MAGRKSTVDEIRARFDQNVERFSNLDTGQSATMDAPLVLDLVSEVAAATTPAAKDLLDLGCGAGNFTLKLLERLPNRNCTLVDLSQPMLHRAVERVSAMTTGWVHALQGDMRELDLGERSHDVVVAAAVLHHLRDDTDWQTLFEKLFRVLRPGGSLWIFDLVTADLEAAQEVLWRRYGEYLTHLRDESYREQVFAYIDEEDTPRSVAYQLDLLARVGFKQPTLLHANGPFAAMGAIVPPVD